MIAVDMLRDALGADIAEMLADDATNDVLLNEDGRLWLGQIGKGLVDTGKMLSRENALAALFCIADHVGEPLTRSAPILSGTLPESGERIAGTIEPITTAPTFAIRKPARGVFPLSAFRDTPAEVIDAEGKAGDASAYADLPKRVAAVARAVDTKQFVLVVGNTGSGKTTFMNSLLALPSVMSDRICVIEDTREIQLSAPNAVRLLATPAIDSHRLVQLSLRYRPDRIIVGEVRSGSTALEMIDAANTGHSGGMCSIHANSPIDALDRLAGLVSRVTMQTPFRDVARAVQCVVFVTRTGIISEVVSVDGFRDGAFVVQSICE